MAKPGRKPHEPTAERRRMVETLIAFGIKQESIAGILDISADTLQKYYATEIALGADKVTAQVANSLVKKALSDRPDAVNAAKFYLQAKAGWAEKTQVEVTDRTDRLSDEELERIAAGGGAGAASAARGARITH